MAQEAITLESDAFAWLVTEHKLQVEGPIRGYFYTGKRGKTAWELYKTYAGKKWIYQARRICTQDAAGPAVLAVRIHVNPDQVARLIAMEINGPASAGNVSGIRVYDEDMAQIAILALAAATANVSLHLPSIGTAATATNNRTQSLGYILPPGNYLLTGASVSLITETLAVGVVMELYNVPTLPVWDTTGSAGTPNLAASTISAANTLTEVLC